jgi:lipoyl(octanoyl) transferase
MSSKSPSQRILRVTDLGRQHYEPVHELQREYVEARAADRIPDTLLFVEHDPVYTLGRNADPSHILLSQPELAARGITVASTGRGGDVTYHGPGQIVGYPIISLKGRGGPRCYVEHLEQALIHTLARFDVVGTVDPANRGVWVGDEKIAALGVRIVRQTTMHGFALNVCVNLDDYAGIIPCGIEDKGVTSLDRLVPDIAIETVKIVLLQCFASVFQYGNIEHQGEEPLEEDGQTA